MASQADRNAAAAAVWDLRDGGVTTITHGRKC